MKLSKIIKGLACVEIVNFVDIDVECLTHYSKDCINNSLFFCIEGASSSGNDFVEEAVSLGARAIVSNKRFDCDNIVQIIVKDVRVSMSIMAGNFYGNSHKRLEKIAIIGTNGKTTTATVIANILSISDKKVGIIGTNGVYINGERLPNNFTTPDPIELHYIFDQMLSFGIEVVVMEVSAHAIYYNKLYGVKFDYAVFTNVSNEHLDFFKTMENYINIKKSFFNKKNVKEAVVNIDDKVGVEIAKESSLPIVSYGIYNPANVFAVNIKVSIDGSEFVVNVNDDVFSIRSCLVGEYNVYNILASIACCKLMGIENRFIIKALKNLKQIEGRFIKYSRSLNRKIIIDFAHTPDGFEKVLSLIKKLRKGKIITVFGCVGYSDKYKRQEMGRIASKYSDELIITTDNIGFENFDVICRDIEDGISKGVSIKIEDRKTAIGFAFDRMRANDTLVLLGKGNESKQVVKDQIIKYCDIDVVEGLLAGEEV